MTTVTEKKNNQAVVSLQGFGAVLPSASLSFPTSILGGATHMWVRGAFSFSVS